MPLLIAAVVLGGLAVLANAGSGVTPNSAPTPRQPRRARLLRSMPGYAVEERVAINAFNAIVRVFGMVAPPDLEFTWGADLHYDPSTHAVRMDLRVVRQMLRAMCDDDVCARHAITAFMAHEMRHSMQAHAATDGLAVRREHEDDADFHIGVALARLGLDPAEVHHIMEHLGGSGGTEHSPGPRRAALVWAGYDWARGGPTA